MRSLSVAIPTYNRGRVLLQTIAQLFDQTCPALEIIVVDQSESHPPEVRSELQRLSDTGRIVYLELERANLPAARNVALTVARGDVVVFIDDDVLLPVSFLEAHAEAYKGNSEVVAVAGRVEQRLGWSVKLGRGEWAPICDYQKLPLNLDFPISPIGNMIGCNHSVQRLFALSIGGYDAGYRGMALREDTDLALRIALAGGIIRYEPRANLVHLATPSEGCRRREAADMSGAICLFRFLWKFRLLLGRAVFYDAWRSARLSFLSKQVVTNPRIWPIVAKKIASAVTATVRDVRVNFPVNEMIRATLLTPRRIRLG